VIRWATSSDSVSLLCFDFYTTSLATTTLPHTTTRSIYAICRDKTRYAANSPDWFHGPAMLVKAHAQTLTIPCSAAKYTCEPVHRGFSLPVHDNALTFRASRYHRTLLDLLKRKVLALRWQPRLEESSLSTDYGSNTYNFSPPLDLDIRSIRRCSTASSREAFSK
jgi:hypothetical protein